MSKKNKIKILEEELNDLNADYQRLVRDYNDKCNQLFYANKTVTEPAPKLPFWRRKYDRFYTLSVELNPLAWSGGRLYRFDWRKAGSKTREGQANFGPFSFSWYREQRSA